jgi:hypothetical protein
MEERPSQNSEDGAPEDGLAGRNVAPVSGELEAEKARVRAGTRNLAVLSGCFVVVMAMAIFAPLVYFHFFATAVSSAASNAFQNTAKTVAAFINRARAP